jgi:hypothetical protein
MMLIGMQVVPAGNFFMFSRKERALLIEIQLVRELWRYGHHVQSVNFGGDL